MVSSNFSPKGVSRNCTFKDSQKKANEKINYGQQNTSYKTNDGIRSSGVDSGGPEWQAVPAPLVA